MLDLTRIASPPSKRLYKAQAKKIGSLTKEESRALIMFKEKLIFAPVIAVMESS